jgi:hypothetical protein
LDEVYRGFRIAISDKRRWVARITHVRGSLAPFSASSTVEEGQETCGRRAREQIDRYLAFLRDCPDED